jgi:hypothetical protein
MRRQLVTPDDLAGLIAKSAPLPKRSSPKAISAAAKLRVLELLSGHGHLRCSELQSVLWPSSQFKYGTQLANRCTAAMSREGTIVRRRNSIGGYSFVLSRLGAAALEVRGIPARHGLDLTTTGPNFVHHSLTSIFCLFKATEGVQAFHEYGIVTNRAPFTAAHLIDRYGKLCDAALVTGNRVIWCECEQSPKSNQQLGRVLALAHHVGQPLNSRYTLGGVCCIFDGSLKHGERIARVARSLWSPYGAAECDRLASTVTLANVTVDLPLRFRGCAESPLLL